MMNGSSDVNIEFTDMLSHQENRKRLSRRSGQDYKLQETIKKELEVAGYDVNYSGIMSHQASIPRP